MDVVSLKYDEANLALHNFVQAAGRHIDGTSHEQRRLAERVGAHALYDAHYGPGHRVTKLHLIAWPLVARRRALCDWLRYQVGARHHQWRLGITAIDPAFDGRSHVWLPERERECRAAAVQMSLEAGALGLTSETGNPRARSLFNAALGKAKQDIMLPLRLELILTLSAHFSCVVPQPLLHPVAVVGAAAVVCARVGQLEKLERLYASSLADHERIGLCADIMAKAHQRWHRANDKQNREHIAELTLSALRAADPAFGTIGRSDVCRYLAQTHSEPGGNARRGHLYALAALSIKAEALGARRSAEEVWSHAVSRVTKGLRDSIEGRAYVSDVEMIPAERQ